jgi:hypothetical protein
MATLSAAGQQGTASAPAGVSLDYFDSSNTYVANPIQPFTFSRTEVSLGIDPRPEMFDQAQAGQRAEAMDLALRNMIRDGTSEAETRAALDKLARWHRKVDALRQQYYAGGAAALEALAQRSPRDIRVLARCASRWVEALESERVTVLSDIRPEFRDEFNNMVQVRVDPQTYQWKFPKPSPFTSPNEPVSAAFPKAKHAVQRALTSDPNDAEALFDSAMLLRRELGASDEEALAAAKRGSSSQGSYASAARVFVLLRDTSGPYAMEARASKLREVVRGPGESSETSVGTYTGQTLSANQSVRNGTVYQIGVRPGPIIHSPSPQELAQADALDAEARRLQARATAEIDVVVKAEPSNLNMLVLLATYHGHALTTDRILRYSMFLNPSDYRLHWLRSTEFAKGKSADLGETENYTYWALRKGYAQDWSHCKDLFEELNNKYKEPFAKFAIASHCMRLRPLHPAGHRALAISFMEMSKPIFTGSQMKDAFEQGQLESEVMFQVGARLIEHPEEWAPSDNAATITKYMALAKYLRGEYSLYLNRNLEARKYLSQSISLDPTATPAQQALDRMKR